MGRTEAPPAYKAPMEITTWTAPPKLENGTLTIYGDADASTIAQLEDIDRSRPEVERVVLTIKSAEAVASHPKLERIGIVIYGLGSTVMAPVLEALGPSMVYVTLSQDRVDRSSVPITAEMLKPLAGCQRLEVLDLGAAVGYTGGPSISDDDLSPLASLSSLHRLVLPIGLTGTGLAHVPRSLKELSLAFGREDEACTASQVEHLIRLEELEKLYLGAATPERGALASLGQMRSLRDLTIRGAIEGEALGFLADLALARLELRSSVKLKKAPGLSAASSLVILDLNRTTFAPKVLASLGGLSELRSLRTIGKCSTDPGVEGLRGHENLRVLTLSGSKMTDTSAEAIASIENLRCLHLHSAKITAKGLEQIVQRELVELSMSNVGIGDAMIPALEKLTSARFIRVTRCKLSKAGLKGLKAHDAFTDRLTGDNVFSNITKGEDGWLLRYSAGLIRENRTIFLSREHVTEPA